MNLWFNTIQKKSGLLQLKLYTKSEIGYKVPSNHILWNSIIAAKHCVRFCMVTQTTTNKYNYLYFINNHIRSLFVFAHNAESIAHKHPATIC